MTAQDAESVAGHGPYHDCAIVGCQQRPPDYERLSWWRRLLRVGPRPVGMTACTRCDRPWPKGRVAHECACGLRNFT